MEHALLDRVLDALDRLLAATRRREHLAHLDGRGVALDAVDEEIVALRERVGVRVGMRVRKRVKMRVRV